MTKIKHYVTPIGVPLIVNFIIVYPTLVKEFYANMRENKNATLRHIEIVIKGVHIELDKHKLAMILSVLDDGPWINIDYYNTKVLSNPTGASKMLMEN
jgi:hypothetical protein